MDTSPMNDFRMHVSLRRMIDAKKGGIVRALQSANDGMTVTELRRKVTGITKYDPAMIELVKEGSVTMKMERRHPSRSSLVYRLTVPDQIT